MIFITGNGMREKESMLLCFNRYYMSNYQRQLDTVNYVLRSLLSLFHNTPIINPNRVSYASILLEKKWFRIR